MPEPITPDPTTPTVRTSRSAAIGLLDDDDDDGNGDDDDDDDDDDGNGDDREGPLSNSSNRCWIM